MNVSLISKWIWELAEGNTKPIATLKLNGVYFFEETFFFVLRFVCINGILICIPKRFSSSSGIAFLLSEAILRIVFAALSLKPLVSCHLKQFSLTIQFAGYPKNLTLVTQERISNQETQLPKVKL